MPLFTLPANTHLILASASPRRQAFLEMLGVPFTIDVSPAIEAKPLPSEGAEEYSMRAAKAKAYAVAEKRQKEARESIILAADTVVVLNTRILGKPETPDNALEMLSALSGRKHTVISSVYVLLPKREERSFGFTDATAVFFHPIAKELLKAYVATEEPLDKAGAYAIQGKGAFLVQRIEGSWSTVVGLPVDLLVKELMLRKLLFPAKTTP
ncbi:MAG: septum formation protein Maf [Desulfovibrio sp.]|nr:septum formation protein Maf [Desulfovibrio sp.]